MFSDLGWKLFKKIVYENYKNMRIRKSRFRVRCFKMRVFWKASGETKGFLPKSQDNKTQYQGIQDSNILTNKGFLDIQSYVFLKTNKINSLHLSISWKIVCKIFLCFAWKSFKKWVHENYTIVIIRKNRFRVRFIFKKNLVFCESFWSD